MSHSYFFKSMLALGYLVGLGIGASGYPVTATAATAAAATTVSPTAPILTEYKRFYREIDIKWDATGPNVIELFSYSCSMCQTAESAVRHFDTHKPKKLRFEALALTTSDMGWKLSQYAFRGAHLAGVGKAVHADLFHQMNVAKKPFQTKEDVRNYFKKKGLLDKVDPFLESDASRQLRDRIYDIAIAANIQRTPSFIVNGKYVVAWGSDQKPEKLTALLLALHEKSKPISQTSAACNASADPCKVSLARGIAAP